MTNIEDTPSVQSPHVQDQNTAGVFTEMTYFGCPECILVEIKIFHRALFFLIAHENFFVDFTMYIKATPTVCKISTFSRKNPQL